MRSISSKFLLIFIALSLVGSIKIYTGASLYWAILLSFLMLAAWNSLLYKSLAQNLQILFVSLRPYGPMFIGWGLFIAGIAIAGFFNGGMGLYTIAKYIAILFVLLMLLMIGVSATQLEKALILALACSLIPLILLIIFRANNMLIILGDGRMGWLAIWPGVLWKVGAYIWPFSIWCCLRRPNYANFLLAFAAILAMALDGSRTSMLWLILSWGGLFVISFNLKNRHIWCHICLLLIVILAFGIIQPILLSWANLPYESLSTATAKILNSDIVSKSASIRLVEGDSFTRAQMFQDGWKHVREVFPWGCGFGCTGILHNNVHIVLHMTYLQILGDGGVISIIGYALFLLFPLYRAVHYVTENKNFFIERFDQMVTPISIILLYLFLGLLHPVSNELTEWGIVLTAISVVVMHVTNRQK